MGWLFWRWHKGALEWSTYANMPFHWFSRGLVFPETPERVALWVAMRLEGA